jgi:hypothetical protein
MNLNRAVELHELEAQVTEESDQEQATRALLGNDLYAEARRRNDMDPDRQTAVDVDEQIRGEFAAMLSTKDPRPFIRVACPDCGRIAGFLINPDGSLYPDTCVPCGEARDA